MATCKDCLHHKSCFNMAFRCGCKAEALDGAETCEDFKSEADYIERANLLDGISSAECGLDEIIDELIYKHNLDFLHDNDEDAVRKFAKDLIDCIKNYIKHI